MVINALSMRNKKNCSAQAEPYVTKSFSECEMLPLRYDVSATHFFVSSSPLVIPKIDFDPGYAMLCYL